jgi:hypothetical protein
MKRLLLVIALTSAIVYSCSAQDTDKAARTARFSGTALTAVVLTVDNQYASMNVSFEEKFSGAPATASTVILGCMSGGTCDAALDTNATSTNTIKSPALTKPYDYFTVTPTFTGGTTPTLTLNVTMK